mmetsp:Transcript_2034/g.2863  ORF Transcript_2034/g.2863 Transcript_2034/m.2863 type:complete len:114 (+) Transcript_2034:734-1075(+)
MLLTGLSVLGQFHEQVYPLVVLATVVGELVRGLVDLAVAFPTPHDNFVGSNHRFSPNVRCGAVDDAMVQVFAGTYTMSTSWLALRAGTTCPDWLPMLDVLVGPVAISVFVSVY